MRRKVIKPPSEDSEQIRVVRKLTRLGIYVIHVPMGGARARGSGAAMRRLGAKKAFPDLLVFDRPKVRLPGGRVPAGAAIEMKRIDGGDGASAEQLEELSKLEARGWLTAVCDGADEAFEMLRAWGYAV